jgi:hypothetical protein
VGELREHLDLAREALGEVTLLVGDDLTAAASPEIGSRARTWPDGRTHVVLEPAAFLGRLVGSIPPPGRHLVRSVRVFGSASTARAKLRAVGMTVWDVWLVGTKPDPAIGSEAALNNGNPSELNRCYKAADGDQNTRLVSYVRS